MSTPAKTPGLRDRVEKVLDRIRPYIMMDGGNVELVNVHEDTGVVEMRFVGACHGCPSSMMTLQMGIENELRAEIPEITQVVAV
jgi:Fe-S cluster biogenesis protein NfuA